MLIDDVVVLASNISLFLLFCFFAFAFLLSLSLSLYLVVVLFFLCGLLQKKGALIFLGSFAKNCCMKKAEKQKLLPPP